MVIFSSMEHTATFCGCRSWRRQPCRYETSVQVACGEHLPSVAVSSLPHLRLSTYFCHWLLRSTCVQVPLCAASVGSPPAEGIAGSKGGCLTCFHRCDLFPIHAGDVPEKLRLRYRECSGKCVFRHGLTRPPGIHYELLLVLRSFLRMCLSLAYPFGSAG